jgi:DNA polymerase III sliding clamp (beta) subunit (PCNA family)
MKITLNRNDFLDELLFVNSLVVKNTLNEKYKLVHCFNANGVLTLLSADNGLAFTKATYNTGIDDAFSFAIVPDKFITILKNFTTDTFNLTIDGNKVVVSSGKSKYSFKIQDALNIFPESTNLEDSTDCNYILFKKSIEIASAFTKVSESTQYTLTVFEMKLTPTNIGIRSSDGNKMVHSYMEDPVDDRNVVIHIDRDYAYVLDKLDRAERLKIEKYQNNMIFISDNRTVKIMSKVGSLPDTDGVINKCKLANTSSHIVSNSVLLEPLKRLSMILDGKIKKVNLIFGDNSTGTDQGSFSLNGIHFMDVLKHSGENVKLNFSPINDFAIYITDENDSHFVLGKTV